jgi:cation:H+ antiporter
MGAVFLLFSMAVIVAGAFVFTNAVEWAGHALGLGVGAVGSIVAAVATALPESAIPIIALIGGGGESEQVAIGAIVGAPFVLATVAMAVVGSAALAFAERREQGRRLDAHLPSLSRDLAFFLGLFSVALVVGIGAPPPVRWAAALLLVAAYAVYAVLTFRGGGGRLTKDELDPLLFARKHGKNPPRRRIAAQFLVGVALIVGGANVFVEELVHAAEALGVDSLVLTLLIAPLATELPEKANSVLWISEGQDTLALGNVTGALVFQSSLAVAIGVAFTSWELGAAAYAAGGLALAGGLVAMWALVRRSCFTGFAIALWAGLFGVFAATVLVFA